jgi:ADP-ribosylglycohydrolase
MTERDRLLGGLWGAITGDALGMPVEGYMRSELEENPVTEMMDGPAAFPLRGSWTDDSSLMLCTAECLLDGFDTRRLADLFLRWDKEGYWTPFGRAFGHGNTTVDALERLEAGIEPELAGGAGEYDNGNGSLMRILPVALWYADHPIAEMIETAHRASAVTHRHPRSWIACGFYCIMAAALLQGIPPERAYQNAIDQTEAHYALENYADELSHFERLLSGRIGEIPKPEINSSGYVIDTLEASIWCLLTSDTFEEAVLKAVNLGGDTDTTGIVTGGLAGLTWGVDAIPQEWIQQLGRHEDIGALFDEFTSSVLDSQDKA